VAVNRMRQGCQVRISDDATSEKVFIKASVELYALAWSSEPPGLIGLEQVTDIGVMATNGEFRSWRRVEASVRSDVEALKRLVEESSMEAALAVPVKPGRKSERAQRFAGGGDGEGAGRPSRRSLIRPGVVSDRLKSVGKGKAAEVPGPESANAPATEEPPDLPSAPDLPTSASMPTPSVSFWDGDALAPPSAGDGSSASTGQGTVLVPGSPLQAQTPSEDPVRTIGKRASLSESFSHGHAASAVFAGSGMLQESRKTAAAPRVSTRRGGLDERKFVHRRMSVSWA
jgi:hypothetical protein